MNLSRDEWILLTGALALCAVWVTMTLLIARADRKYDTWRMERDLERFDEEFDEYKRK